MNKLDFNGGAYRCEVVEGAIFEGNVGNLVAHFATDTITLHDRATRSAVSILSSRTENLQINGSVVSFEQAQTIIENALKQGGGGGASSADAVSYDNTTSGLQSTNVQSALDEVGANLGGFNFDIEYSDNDEYGNEIYTFTNQQQLIDFKRLYLNGMVKNISITINSSDSNDVFYPDEKWEGKNADGNIEYVEFYCNFTEGSIIGISIDLNSIEDSSAYQTNYQKRLSQWEYDAMQTKDPNTLYFITD